MWARRGHWGQKRGGILSTIRFKKKKTKNVPIQAGLCCNVPTYQRSTDRKMLKQINN